MNMKNKLNSFIVEGKMVSLEKLEKGSVLKIEYKNNSFLNICFIDSLEDFISRKYKQNTRCRIVGMFVGNHGLYAQNIDIEGSEKWN